MIRWSGCGGSVWGCLRRPSGSAMVSRPFVRDKKVFVSYADHHHNDRLSFWCHAPAGAQQALVEADPQRFFQPPCVGGRGWIGCTSTWNATRPSGRKSPNWSRTPIEWSHRAACSTGWCRAVRSVAAYRCRPPPRSRPRPFAGPGDRAETPPRSLAAAIASSGTRRWCRAGWAGVPHPPRRRARPAAAGTACGPAMRASPPRCRLRSRRLQVDPRCAAD